MLLTSGIQQSPEPLLVGPLLRIARSERPGSSFCDLDVCSRHDRLPVRDARTCVPASHHLGEGPSAPARNAALGPATALTARSIFFGTTFRKPTPPVGVRSTRERPSPGSAAPALPWHCSISPARYAVWLSKANHTCRVALHASHLGLHLLTSDQRELARLFGTLSGDAVDKFSLCTHHIGPHGIPLLDECPNRLVVRRTGFFGRGQRPRLLRDTTDRRYAWRRDQSSSSPAQRRRRPRRGPRGRRTTNSS